MNKLKNAWITINRQCNLRCKWCYAESTEFKKTSDMSFALAKNVIDLIAELKIEILSLTGGEPTCHTQIEEIIRYANSKKMNVTLVTNGLALSDKHFLESLISQGLTGVNLSIKGYSNKDYQKNTGVKAYDSVLKAINNVSVSNVDHIVSIVLSNENIDNYLYAVKDAVSNGAKAFYFSFEHDFSVLDGKDKTYDIRTVFDLINGFKNSYKELDSITNGRFILHQSLPICIWDKNFINVLNERNQIVTSCQLLERSGVIFDSDGSLIPCNFMYQVSLAKYGQDFFDRDSFLAFWNSPKVVNIYNQFCNHVGEKCYDCREARYCGGGCLSNWYNFNYTELMNEFKLYNEM